MSISNWIQKGNSPDKSQFVHAIGELLGVGEQEIVPDERRRKNTLVFTVIGTFSLLAFGLININDGQNVRLLQLGWIQVLEVCLLLIPAIVLTYRGTRPVWSENALVLSGFVIFASNNVFGGHTGDSPYWSFVYPYLVFFLRGQKIGWIVGVAYIAIVPSLMYFSSNHWNIWHYQTEHCVFYAISYAFNVLTAAYVNLLRSNFQNKLMELVAFNTGEARRHLETLQYNASHDQGTGLLNRQGLIEALDACLERAYIFGRHIQVVYISLSRAAELAAIVGLDKVDESIRQLAQQLPSHLPELQLIARLGQDKLALVLYCNSIGSASIEPIRAIRQIPGGSEKVDFSVHVEYVFGVAVQHPQRAIRAADLLRKAEQALLFAHENKLDYQFYDSALNQHFLGKNLRYEKLRVALYDNQLTLHYQPQVDLVTGKIAGAEALARWFDPTDGMILPGKFIPIIETTGLLHRFSVWSVETAVRDCAQWQRELPGVSVSINLSAGALMDIKVLESLEQALQQWKLDPSLVIVELTESVLLISPKQALARIDRLLKLGARLSIDDYGAGFSSLTYLKQLPAHEMKIDMSFVQQLATNVEDQAIVKSSIALGHDLQLSVLAEGIEDAMALKLLIQSRCDLGQGWYFSKALPLSEFIAWVPPPISDSSSFAGLNDKASTVSR